MKATSRLTSQAALIAAALTAGTAWTAAQETAAAPKPLEFAPSGLHEVKMGFRPNNLHFSDQAPEGLAKAPDGLAKPRYASFKIGPAAAPATILVLIDQGDGAPGRMWLDANGNGDLTDDPAVEWVREAYERPGGEKGEVIHTTAKVSIPFSSGPRDAALRFFLMEGQGAPYLIYTSDYHYKGELEIGGRKIPTLLSDAGCTGDLKLSGHPLRDPLLWLDLNGDGQPAPGEIVNGGRSFEVDGKWWKLTGVSADGLVTVGPGEKPVPAAAVESPLDPGKVAPAFTGKTVEGKEVKFPGDFKGKIVLIDFWATWCGPCLAEVPNVVAAHKKFQDQGLVVLGISLDRTNMEEKVREVCKSREMNWDQVYDGGGWSAAIAKQYGVRSIPHMLLVDGDTGVIIRNKDIRGDRLIPAIQEALDKKKDSGKAE